MRALGHFPRVRRHARNLLVAVIGIVVEHKEPPHAALHRKGHGVLETTVPPADPLVVLGGIILRIENEHIGAADEFQRAAVLFRDGV